MATPTLRMISWPVALMSALAVALLAVSPVMSAIALCACAAAALIGPSFALQALTTATLIAYANPAIVKLTPLSGVLVRVVLLAAVVRILPLLRGSDLRLVWPVWLFGLVSVLTSTLRSPAPDISIMKVITFTLAATTVLMAFAHIRAERLPRIQTWFLSVGFSVMALSALTLLKPGLGIGSDGGLQGLLGQPQSLGIFIAPFAAWSVTGVLLMRTRVSRLELWGAVAAVILIILTRARTAAFATAFAVVLIMLSRLAGRRTRLQASFGRPIIIAALASAALAIAGLMTGKVGSFITAFAYKDYGEAHRNLGGAFYDSRGSGVISQWHSFLASPLIGNGFGVYPDGRFPSGVVRFAGIPISAPVEKGFLPTAILEEGGILGAVGLVVFIAWLGRSAWRTPDLRWRAVFLACLGINIGECVLLSPGGIGLLDWLLIGLTVSAHRAALLVPRATQSDSSCSDLPLGLGQVGVSHTSMS